MSPIQQKSHSISDCNMVMSDLDTYNRARERWEATSGLRSIDRRRNLFSVSSSCNPAHERKVVDDREHKPEEVLVSKSTALLKTHERIEDDKFPSNLEGEYSSNRLLEGATDDGGSGVGIVKGHINGGDYFGATAASEGSPPAAPSSGFKFGKFSDSKTDAAAANTMIGGIQNIRLVLEGSTSKNEANFNLTEEDGGGCDVANELTNSDDNYNSEDELPSENATTTTNSSDISNSEREEEFFKAIAAFDSVVGDNPAVKSIGIEEFPLLFEKLGTVYCEEEHRNTFKKLQDENGCVVKDVFINWYIDWLFGENESDEFSGRENDEVGGNQAVITSGDDKNCDNEVLSSRLSGFGDSFKLSIGNWKCDSCCVTNCERDLKCIACEISRVGISNSTSPDTTKVELSNNGGLFGGSNSNMDSVMMKRGIIGSTGFIFGGGNSTSNSSGGVVFGTTSQDGSSLPSSGFKFGGMDSPKTGILDAPTGGSKSKGFVFNV